jgi:hypothetical protein
VTILAQGLTTDRAPEPDAPAPRDAAEAIEYLTEANRLRRSAAVERRLVAASRGLAHSTARCRRRHGRPLFPMRPLMRRPTVDRHAGAADGGSALAAAHGCVVVRGPVPPACMRLRAAIERTFDATTKIRPPRRTAETAACPRSAGRRRRRAEPCRQAARASVLAADSPRTL